MSELIARLARRGASRTNLTPRRRSSFVDKLSLARTIRKWIARSRERSALRELVEHDDAHLLGDIGVTRAEALRRAAKWFWQP
jgi:uncharacterized protein YjiS (DUF1127 family)